ncbi:MAG: helix-turn-helix transcriptional regulator [Verrucomicrobiaceae bacterium]
MPLPPEITADAWRSLRCEWLWVYRGAVPVCGVWSAEIPVPAGVFFVEQGSGRIRADGKEIMVKRGEAFFSAPGPRQHWFAPGTRLLSVGFRCLWPDERPVFRAGLNFAGKDGTKPLKRTAEAGTPQSSDPENESLRRSILCGGMIHLSQLRTATLELFRRVHRGRKAVTFREAVKPMTHALAGWSAREAAFQSWFAVWCEVMRKHGTSPEPQTATKGRRSRVEQLIAWLDTRPLDQTTPTLPPGFGLGLRRADQLLQQHLGTSLRGHLERRRLDAARERVLAGESTLKQIAFELGFRHASHFTAWFRRQVGVSPSVYRAGGSEAA